MSLYPVLPGAGDAFTEDGRMVAVRLQDVVSPLHGGGPLAAGGEVAHIRLGLSVRLRPDSPARVPAVPGLDAVEGLPVNHGIEAVPATGPVPPPHPAPLPARRPRRR